MKIPLRIKETLYHDSETGKPVGSEYWVFDDAAEELFVINDDEDAARRIVAAVNACEGIDTESLETIQTINIGNYFNLKRKTVAELDRLRQKNAELLEALKGVCDNMGWDDDTLDHIEYVRAARAAIAEAEQHEPAEPTHPDNLRDVLGLCEQWFYNNHPLAVLPGTKMPVLVEIRNALYACKDGGRAILSSADMGTEIKYTQPTIDDRARPDAPENPATAEITSEQILKFMGQAAPFVPREKIWMLPPTLTPSEIKEPSIVEVRPTQQIVQAYGGGILPRWENMRAPQPTPEIPKVVVPKQDAIPYAQPTTMKKILFLDTETVGLPGDPNQPYTNHQNWPEMVSIAWQLQSESGEYITAGDYIVAPRPGVENGATHINGITPEMQETYGTEIRVILKKLLEAFADADLVVAHNVQFDQPVIFAELDRLGYEIPWKEWYCTKAQSVDLCRIPNPSSRYAGKWKWPSLDELHQFLFNEPIKGRDEFHGAAVDMWACARCYYEMQRRAAGPKDYPATPIL